MRNLDPGRARWIRFRMAVVCGLMALGLGMVITAAYGIEVRDGEAWRAMAEKQRMRRLHVAPKRGTIYDRNGTPLAISVEVPSVSVDAVEMLRGIEEQYVPMRIRQYAERIAEALRLTPEEVVEKLERRRRFAWLKRRVTKEEIEAVRALGDGSQRYPIRGLVIEGEGFRFYPHRELAAAVLGFVSPSGEGREGVERALDVELRGRGEEIRGLRDRAGRLIFAEGIQDESTLAGHNVHLTLDQAIQYIAERELRAAVQTYEAVGGSIVVVDPASGEVLAMANEPSFNPNDYSVSDPEARRNRAIMDRFEPGSTLKVFTMAAALAAKTVAPDTTIYCEEGHMPIDNVVIHDTHVSKWLTPTQILQLSSNIGISKIALGLGPRRLYEGMKRFGFAEPTGMPLPAESAGVLRPRGRPWVPVETAAAGFGQGVSVTNVQMAMAMAALANRGQLLEPILVQKVTDSTGAVLTEATPKVRRRVVSRAIARLVAEMLTSVTEGEGTGVEAAIDGFRVAGKTATAQKIDPATGRYKDGSYVASFLGFVPAEAPRLVVAVVIDEPMGGAYAGGTVAAPVFRRVSEASLRYLGVRPEGTRAAKLGDVAAYAKGPDPAKAAHEAVRDAARGPSAPEDEGDEPAKAATNQPAAAPGAEQIRVPDLTGLPMRAALQALLQLGLRPSVDGSGRVERTEPAAGANVAKGSEVTVVFEPPS